MSNEVERLRAELDTLQWDTVVEQNRKLRAENIELAELVDRMTWQLNDFMDYFRPRGGVSDVPLGPFERTTELFTRPQTPHQKLVRAALELARIAVKVPPHDCDCPVYSALAETYCDYDKENYRRASTAFIAAEKECGK